MANSKDGQGDKDKYLDTSRKILSQEKLICNTKALILIFLKVMTKVNFKKKGQLSRSKGLVHSV